MDKEQKAALVEEIASDLSGTTTIFAIDYRGISVPQAAELRARLAEADATFKVVKNRLAKRAAEQAGADGLEGLLEGPTALTLVEGDAVLAAKAISTFSRSNAVLAYKGGIMDGSPLDPDGFQAIARLPGSLRCCRACDPRPDQRQRRRRCGRAQERQESQRRRDVEVGEGRAGFLPAAEAVARREGVPPRVDAQGRQEGAREGIRRRSELSRVHETSRAQRFRDGRRQRFDLFFLQR